MNVAMTFLSPTSAAAIRILTQLQPISFSALLKPEESEYVLCNLTFFGDVTVVKKLKCAGSVLGTVGVEV